MKYIPVVLLLTALTVISCGGDNPTQWTFEPFSATVVDSTFTVPADSVQAFFAVVTVDEYIRNIVLDGEFQVLDGGGASIQAFVMRDYEYSAFLSGEPFLVMYGSNEVSTGTFLLPIESTDVYQVVFSNKSSATTDRTVKAKVTISWEEQVSTSPD